MARLVLDQVCKTHRPPRRAPVPAVRGVSFSVEAGSRVALVGPSGCGKTTTLRLIAGLEDPDAGTISIDGVSLAGLAPPERNVGLVFQDPALYPHLTVAENLALGLRLRRRPESEVTAQTSRLADLLGLGALAGRRPAELSGGERQRVALGRALAWHPRVLLLDEPFAHLDPVGRARLRLELIRIHRELQLTLLVVTHDQQDAVALGERVVVMNEGAVEQLGSPADIYHRPANRFVAAFVGAPPMNFLPGHCRRREGQAWFVAGSSGASPALELPLPGAGVEDEDVILGVRPEHLTVTGGADGRWRGAVELVSGVGPDTVWAVRVGPHRLLVRAPAGNGQSPPAGTECGLSADVARVHLFSARTGARL